MGPLFFLPRNDKQFLLLQVSEHCFLWEVLLGPQITLNLLVVCSYGRWYFSSSNMYHICRGDLNHLCVSPDPL